MKTKTYIPDTGHIIELHFERAAGVPGPDRKPALVLSPAAYNQRTGLVISCAITTTIKGYPFEVLLKDNKSAILADQIKSLDWKNTRISQAGRVQSKELDQVRAKLDALLFTL